MLKIDEEIKNKLKEQGYSNRKINYQEFLKLYEPYKNEMKEADFANILGILYNNFYRLKNKQKNAIILKTQISIERIKEIKNSLIEQGFANNKIDYQEFLRLYEPYKNEMKESDFANILGISNSALCNLKKLKTNAIILKTHTSLERIEEIKNSLIEQGFANNKIDYQEFLQLYEPYKNEMKETDFANILGILSSTMCNFKNLKVKAIILKTQISEKRKKEIRNILINQEFSNNKIDYQEFLRLYEPYKNEMKESDFANILGISNSNFYSLKNKQTRARAIILKTEISLEKIEEIKDSLIGQGFSNYSIDYQEFLQLYELYKNEMTEKDFANILGLSYAKFYILKNKQKKAIILKTQISIERIKEIKNSLINQGYSNSKIDYQEFLQLYESYKNEIKEKDFANILGISYDNLYKIKTKHQKARILKSIDETISNDTETSHHEIFSSEDDIEKIIDQKEEKTLNQENIITEMKTFFDSGLNNKETMNIIMKKYNLNKEELLKILNLELDKKNKSKNNNCYLGKEL